MSPRVAATRLVMPLAQRFLLSKSVRNAKDGNKKGGLVSIGTLTKICNHPQLIQADCDSPGKLHAAHAKFGLPS